MNISVLGCGRWGSFIAWYLDKTGHNVKMWGLSDAPQFIEIKNKRKNNILTFREELEVTDNLHKAVSQAEVLVISISSQAVRSFMKDLSKEDLNGKIIVLCMKGIEESTGKRLSEVVEEFVPNDTKIAIWVGPGHPQDFSNGIPNCMVIDSKCEETKKYLVYNLSSDLIRFYIGTDLIGNEIGAATKNVIGIAAGILDGLGYTSLKGALMSRGTREIARIIKAVGGNEISAYGLAHLGDYEATLFSKYSHNRMFGEMFVKGEKFDSLAEGVATARAVVKLSKMYNIDLPICNAVNDVINNGYDAKKTIADLFLRSIKSEF